MLSRLGAAVVSSAFLLTACSSGDLLDVSSDTRYLFDKPSSAAEVLASAPSCCSSLGEIRYQQIRYDYAAEEVIDNSRQAFDFSSGKSFVLAYRLPDVLENLPVKIEVTIGDTVFEPTVALLDADFNVNRIIPASKFQYRELKNFNPNALEATFQVRNVVSSPSDRDAYMLIYTTDESLTGSTQIVHPERSRAKAQGKADPSLPDPLIPHSSMGMLKITFNADLSKGIFSDEAWFGSGQKDQQITEVTTNEGQGAAIAGASAGAAVASSANSSAQAGGIATPKVRGKVSPMLEETEAFYNQLIAKSVELGEVEKALKLVEEAEYAGSKSARATFIQAVKNK